MLTVKKTLAFALSLGIAAALLDPAAAQTPRPPGLPTSSSSEFPPHTKVLDGFTKIVTQPNVTPMYSLYVRKKDGQMYAELPRTYSMKRYFLAMTQASGDAYAGLQNADIYVYWRRFDKRLALIQPQISTRAIGDREAASSVKRLFTDRILLDLPIVTIGPSGGPVIDLDAMLLGNSSRLFSGGRGGNGSIASSARLGLFSVSTAKAFKSNIEVAFEVPDPSGKLKKLHFSISELTASTGYKPRVADQRIGFFTTSYTDLAKYNDRDTAVRYINRWHLEKADPKIAVSPPKKPIVFYIEHTTPIRYRRWVKDGILAWNKAFEKVGISDAIEVYYQDASSGAHMDKDPEDVNYNFVRWLNNDVGTAIGPSRVNPLTGQILDADIILTDGWIRHYKNQFSELFPKVAMEGFGPETLAWLADHPSWDPRIRMAHPSQRKQLRAQILRDSQAPLAGHAMGNVDPSMIGDDQYDGLVGRTSQVNGMCLAADGMAFDVAMMRMTMELLAADENAGDEKKDEAKEEPKKEEPKKPAAPKGQLLDGIPETFVGPLVAHLVAHEVGHTLGLRHNFKASSLYTFDEINSDKVKGKKQMAGSVMDYMAANIHADGSKQGDYCMSGIGPYDMWAIEYGYTFGDTRKILSRVAEPELAFGTDEDTNGPDPFARRYDFTKEPLDFAKNQVALARHHRDRLLTTFVKDGESWDRVRYGYQLTLSMQTRTLSMMSNWIGGAFVYRDRKGDPNGRKPVEVVSAERQRKALKFVIENCFRDEAFGITPELTAAMGLDIWWESWDGSTYATWPIHDRIVAIQASTLTMLMNPTTLRRVYDNESRVPADQDCLTLPELLTQLSDSVWTELGQNGNEKYTARKPKISSLRRNLQREHLERLIDLTLPDSRANSASKTISMLAAENLKQLVEKIDAQLAAGANHDQYTTAHLSQARSRIQKALDADYILNPGSGGGGGGGGFIFLRPEEK